MNKVKLLKVSKIKEERDKYNIRHIKTIHVMKFNTSE